MIPATFQVGSIEFHLYGILVSLGIAAGYFLARVRAVKFKISRDIVDTLVLILIPVCLVGARLYHVLDNFDYYFKNPNEIIAIWQGGIGILGAIIFGVITLWIFSKHKKLNFLTLFDLAAPSITLAQAIGRWGNFINQEAFGMPVKSIWGIFIPVEKRLPGYENIEYYFPTFLIESIWLLIVTFILLKYKPRKPGLATGVFLILYGSGRIVVEVLRINTWQVFGIKVGLFVSILFVFLGFYIFLQKRKKSEQSNFRIYK
ncbi:MAG TPA: prolipoprotein diacylglyceryl transferase [Patescibacteria group bacterium]